MVRLHLTDNAPSVEGILERRVDGHYLIRAPKLLEGIDRTVSIEGDLLVPRERVLYVQRIG